VLSYRRRKERRANSKAKTLQNDVQDLVKKSFDETSIKIKEILDLGATSYNVSKRWTSSTESTNTSNFKPEGIKRCGSRVSHNCCESSKQKDGPSANSVWRSLGVSHEQKQVSVSSSKTSFIALPDSTSVEVGHEIQSGGQQCSFSLDYGRGY